MKFMLIISIILIILLTGCTSTRTTASFPKKIEVIKNSPEKPKDDRLPETLKDPDGLLTLKDALRLALIQNPKLSVYELEIRAREANSLQASLFPNPELSFETENFAGSGIYTGVDVSETTVSIGQLIELAGKRHKRTQLAAIESDAAAWDYEMTKLEIYSAVISAYIQVLGLQESVKLDTELLNIARQLQENIVRRVESGKISPAESARAVVIVSTAENNLNRREQQLKAARKQLASTWSGSGVFEMAAGKIENQILLPELDLIIQKLEHAPELSRWAVEIKKREAYLVLSKALAVPDPTISLAYRRINESKDNALVAGLSIPLPFFNRNQGSIQEAKIKLKQAEWEKRALVNSLKTSINNVYINAIALDAEITGLKDKSIPNAEKAHSIINDGYQQGKFQLIDVLDAQRTLFEARNQLLKSLVNYRLAINDLEWLTGQDIASL